MIAVKKQTFKSVLDVTSSTHNNIIATRTELQHCAVRIILGYAPQETDSPDTREHFFTELGIEVTQCKIAGDVPMILGDMNAKVECIEGEPCPKSSNGKLLVELLKEQELEILNFDNRCRGKWTHVVRTSKLSSVLDYAITNDTLAKHLKEVIIDEDCLFCPFSLIKQKNRIPTPKFSDHNSIITTIQLPHSSEKIPQQPSWRLTEDGLLNFHMITSEESFPIQIEGSGQRKYDNYEKLLTETMNQCFKKRKPCPPPTEHKMNKNFTALYNKVMKFARKGKAQRKVARTYVQAIHRTSAEQVAERNKENVKNTLNNITVDNSFSPNSFWELCKKSKKTHNEMGTSVITESGNEVFGQQMIKAEYAKEFCFHLREREIKPELQNYERKTKLLCNMLVEHSKTVKVPNYTKEEFDQVTRKIKKRKSCGRDKIPPEVPLNWGDRMKELSIRVMNSIKQTQEVPYQWFNVLISTLYKNKGSRKMLVNRRGIFLKQILSKLFERLNTNRIEHNIRNIDPFQAGCPTNRSPADQTFLLRGCIDHAKYMNRPLYVVLYDYTQCFDSLWLEDCLLSLWKLGVQNEILSLIRELNKECNIVIKTPAGQTNEFSVKNIVQQGSVCGGILCSSSTGEVADEIKAGGTQIGTSTIKALTYVDDIATVNTLTDNVYYSHEKVKWFSDKKRRGLSVGKCIILPINLRKSDVVPRLYIDNTEVSVKKVAPYLGDQFNDKGTNTDLIQERVKKGKSCIVNSMALCGDITMGIHAVETLFLLYQSLFLPVILYNAQAWSNLTKTDLLTIQRVQLKFIKRIFHAPSSTSNSLTYLETGILPLKYEIHVKQLGFLHHILTLPETDPVRLTYQEQLRYLAPNWANEVSNLREEYRILESDAEIADLSKDVWKKCVKKVVTARALEDLHKEAESQQHSENLLPYDNLAAQKYVAALAPKYARKIFHIRTHTIDLRGVRRYMYDDNPSCRLCDADNETVDHVVNSCPAVGEPGCIDIYTTDIDKLREIARRCIEFEEKVENNKNKTV